MDALIEQRAAATTENSTSLFTDPELLHATMTYLAAREGRLHSLHDALGRLAAPAPRGLPGELAPFAAAQIQRRVLEAFGSLERAAQALDGQIEFQRRQPVPAYRRATTGLESDLLARARDTLKRMTAGVSLDEEHIRARLQAAMARPAAPQGPAAGPAQATTHHEAHSHTLTTGSVPSAADHRPGR
jgi:hypothetical protein